MSLIIKYVTNDKLLTNAKLGAVVAMIIL